MRNKHRLILMWGIWIILTAKGSFFLGYFLSVNVYLYTYRRESGEGWPISLLVAAIYPLADLIWLWDSCKAEKLSLLKFEIQNNTLIVHQEESTMKKTLPVSSITIRHKKEMVGQIFVNTNLFPATFYCLSASSLLSFDENMLSMPKQCELIIHE